MRELAEAGTQLLVTVDCGVTSTAEVRLATELGMEVLVTDHHRPAEHAARLPDRAPRPRRGPLERAVRGRCGAQAVRGAASARGRPAGEEDLELAGLATVCDMVPLHGENRRIAREGMGELRRTRRPGLRALMDVAGLDAADADARAAGFRLGPRLNAAGRLGRADAALELLLTEDGDRAGEVARELDGLNHDRRETEQRILHAADAACADQMSAAAIVVAGEGWHPGVVGIVASRLVERHRRPCVVIGLDGDSGRGSGRSIPAYDLHAGLSRRLRRPAALRRASDGRRAGGPRRPGRPAAPHAQRHTRASGWLPPTCCACSTWTPSCPVARSASTSPRSSSVSAPSAPATPSPC